MTSAVLYYNTPLAIQSILTNKFLQYDEGSTKFGSKGDHPFLRVDLKDNLKSEEFVLIKLQQPDYAGPILFGSQVTLCTKNRNFVVPHANGQLRHVPKSKQSSNMGLLQWQILDAKKPKRNNTTVNVYDKICFKSQFGKFLQANKEYEVSSNGENLGQVATWTLSKADLPFIPEWCRNRPFLDSNYLIPGFEKQTGDRTVKSFQHKKRGEEVTKLSMLTSQQQELYLIEDLLYVLMSIDGNYIKRVTSRMDESKFEYKLSLNEVTIGHDKSLIHLIDRILPLCSHHDELKVFINIHSQFAFGLISQAFCATLKHLLKEYIQLVIQFDIMFGKGELTLQKLWFHIQPTLNQMECFVNLTRKVKNAKGGQLIDCIYEMLNNSTGKQKKLIYGHLLHQTLQPYIEMLAKWIYKGVVDDTYNEFMIQEKKAVHKNLLAKQFQDNYWDQRFTLREDQVPQFLSEQSKMILSTGKYINVMRENKEYSDPPFTNDILTNYDIYLKNQDFYKPILQSYQWANQNLIELILTTYKLEERLRSLKHFFFMERGDFFVHFMDSTGAELTKKIAHISKEKLQGILEVAIEQSSTSDDPYGADITCDITSFTLLEQISALWSLKKGGQKGNVLNNVKEQIRTSSKEIDGVNSFVLDYKAEWPLNLILSRKSITKYQILFRHLFFCKYVERQLCNTWHLQQSTRELNLQESFRISYSLIQRMIHFAKSLVYYLSFEVFEMQWQKFQKKIKNVKNFDEILKSHDDYLDQCLKESLLQDYNLFKTLKRINMVCLVFSNIINSFTKQIQTKTHIDLGGKSQNQSLLLRRQRKKEILQETKNLIEKEHFMNVVNQIKKNFDSSLGGFMSQVNSSFQKHETHLTNLLQRLEYDSFYRNYLYGNKIRKD